RLAPRRQPMKFTPVALASLAVLLFVAAFGIGRLLGGGNYRNLAYNLEAAAYEPSAPLAGHSPAGFSGLEAGSDVTGRALISGTVVAISGTSINLSTAAGPVTVNLSGTRSLRRIIAARQSDLRPGQTVVLRLNSA